ncbi:MAG: PAC2 family protein, partial [Actinobacteria bacterium]|nr:PAC2 family protein [Actinomycetota bacterium]
MGSLRSQASTTTQGRRTGSVVRVFNVLQSVNLNDPLLIVALSGWVDAALAGRDTARVLHRRLEDRALVAECSLSELVDLSSTRPTVELEDGVIRRTRWPRIRVTAGSLGRDVVVMRGPEPGLKWPTFCQSVVDLAQHLEVTEAVTVAGMPAAVTHRRPVRVLATATSSELAERVGPTRPDYDGPTGVQTMIQAAFGDAGIPAAGLWAQVPHYLASTRSPSAVRALLGKLSHTYELEIDLAPFDERAASYQNQVEAAVALRSDLRDAVEQLEQVPDVDNLPSADELASEIEEFLRGDS